MNLKEKDIENQILYWLNLQPGCFAFKVTTTGFFDPKLRRFRKNTSKYVIRGCADIIGVYQGKMIAIEVKTPRGLRKFENNPGEHEFNQISFLMKVKEVGGIGICVCDLPTVITLLSKQ